MKKYEKQCAAGRAEALTLLADIGGDHDRLPEVVRMLREAADDESGHGVGVLTIIAAAALRGVS